MKLLNILVFLGLIPFYAIGNHPEPASALEYQQSTDTRIAVEAGFIRFYTGAQERLTINGDGDVGIGTSSPRKRLTISSMSPGIDIYDSDAGTDAKSWQIGGTTNVLHFSVRNDANSEGNDYLAVARSGHNISNVVFPNGNIGIGTTNPGSKLEVVGDNSTIQIKNATKDMSMDDLNNFIRGVDKDDNLLWYVGDGSGARRVLLSARGDGTYPLDFEVNSNTRMRINTNGNVGIGTISPLARLHVVTNGISSFTPAWWSDDAIFENNDHSGITIVSPADKVGHILFGNPANKDAARIHFQHNANKMEFSVQGTKAITIDGSQRVGIGTTSPSAKFHIEDNSGYTWGFIMSNIHSAGHGLMVQGGGTTGERYILQLKDAAGSQRVSVRDTGEVGIGTTTPNHKLHVIGNIHGSTYSADSPPSWPDYVFADSYQLNDLKEVEKFIASNHHLPEIPSEAEVKKNGVDIVDMQAKLLQKIEELTLYVIQQQKEIEKLKVQIEGGETK